MSLKVWIPFTDGTAKNQGTSNLTFTNSNSSKTYSSDTGKLGKCFYNNAYYNGAGLISNETITLPVTLSWFCWAKFDSFGSSASLNGVVTNHDYANKKNMGITILYVSSTTGKLSCNTGNGSGRTYNTYTGSTVLNTGTWYHIGFTYDGSNIKFYINGVLDGTTAYTGLSLGAAKIGIFRWDAMTENSYNMHGSLNDVRIYDHCLTPQEVKEISKGLVAHYTLGSASVLPAITNHASNSGVSGWNNSGTSSRNGNDTSHGTVVGLPVYSIICTSNGNCAITFSSKDATNLRNKKITASCWIYLSGNVSGNIPYLRSTKYDNRAGNYIANMYYQGNNNPTTWPKNTWIRIEGDGTVASDETTVYFCDYVNNNTEYRAYTGWLIEEYDIATPYIAPGTSRSPGIIYDSSGYCYNTTINGAISPSTDTVRYKHCIKFNGSSYASCISPTAEAKTLSLWAYIGSSIPTYNILFADYKSKLSLGFYDSGTHLITSCSGTQMPVGDTSTVKKNAWNHFVVVNNGSRLLYVNGSPVTMSSNNYWNHSSDLLMIGKRADANDGFTEKISDIRLYATALSADDISDLYKLGALIS